MLRLVGRDGAAGVDRARLPALSMRDCGRQSNERSGGVLNRTCLPSDVIAFVVFCRLRYRLTLRDLSELLAHRGIEVGHEAVRDWETKLLPIIAASVVGARNNDGYGVAAGHGD